MRAAQFVQKYCIAIILSYIVIAFELFISYENVSYCYWNIQTQRLYSEWK